GMILALVFTGAALFYFSWVFKLVADWIRQYPLVKRLPGPKGLPVLGNVLDVAGDTTVPLKFFLEEANKAQARGEQTMTVCLLGRTITFPLNGQMTKVICDSMYEIMKGKDYGFLRDWIGEANLLAIDEPWKKMRKFLTPMFHFTMLEGYLPRFNTHARLLVDVLGEERLKGKVDMAHFIKLSTLDAILDTTMGCHFSFVRNPEHPYLKAVDVFTYLSQKYNVEAHMWVNWIWMLLYHRQHKAALDQLHGLTDEVLHERFKAVESGEVDLRAKNRPLIDHFLVLHQDGQMTFDDIHYDINAVIFGGHDTTSASIIFIFWSLACQPDLQQKCYEEIMELFGGDRDRECEPEDLKSLDYTERFIKESMRMFPPVPLIEREMRQDFQMGEALLPRGTEIFINAFIIHHNETAWPDSWRFDPDRFLPEQMATRHTYDYIPFGAGIRNCLGQKFAMNQIKVIVCTLLRHYIFSTEHQLLDQGYATEVVLKPTLGCDLTVTPR
ncbi:hypothetical protein PENTCL1PPCAC_9091, partial [Pristionchus entomophagus]